jgi:hypothetical protein
MVKKLDDDNVILLTLKRIHNEKLVEFVIFKNSKYVSKSQKSFYHI